MKKQSKKKKRGAVKRKGSKARPHPKLNSSQVKNNGRHRYPGGKGTTEKKTQDSTAQTTSDFAKSTHSGTVTLTETRSSGTKMRTWNKKPPVFPPSIMQKLRRTKERDEEQGGNEKYENGQHAGWSSETRARRNMY